MQALDQYQHHKNGVDCRPVCVLLFANGMVFTKDVLDRDDIVKHHNGGPMVNAKVTYGTAIV